MANVNDILKKYGVDPGSGLQSPTAQEKKAAPVSKTGAARVNGILQKYGVDPSPVTPVRQRSGPSIYQQALEKLAATPEPERTPQSFGRSGEYGHELNRFTRESVDRRAAEKLGASLRLGEAGDSEFDSYLATIRQRYGYTPKAGSQADMLADVQSYLRSREKPVMDWAEERKAGVDLGTRAANLIKGGARQYGGSTLNAGGTIGAAALPYAEQQRQAQEQAAQEVADKTGNLWGNILAALSAQPATGSGAAVDAGAAALSGVTREGVERSREMADRLTGAGAENIARAQTGLNPAGRMLVNAGVGAEQMAMDAALGMGNAMIPMMVRSFGGGAQEAREKGYSTEQQVAMGLASAAIEYFSEKLFGGNPVYDKDAGLVNKLVGKVVKNEKVLEVLASTPIEMLNEGLEEIVSDILDPVAEWAIAGKRPEYELDQIIEDGAVGVLTAMIAQGGSHVINAGKRAARPRTFGEEMQAQMMGEEPGTEQGPESAPEESQTFGKVGPERTFQEELQAQITGENEYKKTAPEGAETMEGVSQNGGDQRLEPAQPGQGADTRRAGGVEPAETGERGGTVLDGSQERGAGQRAGEPAGTVERGTEQGAAQSRVQQVQTAAQRQALGRDLPQVSPVSLGINRGVDTPSVKVMPREMWDSEMVKTAERVRQETGGDVTYVLGRIPVKGRQGVRHVRGVYKANGDMVIQADHRMASVEQIAAHETYHDMAARDQLLNETVRQRIAERYTEEELSKVLDRYLERLDGLVELSEDATPEQIEAVLARVREELFADAYAGINAFGLHAERFGEEVRGTVRERNGQARETGRATDRTTGPPEMYSMDSDELPRSYIDFDDRTAYEAAVNEAMQKIRSNGMVIQLTAEEIGSQAGATDWSNLRTARKHIQSIITGIMGKSVQFRIGDGILEAYFTASARDHFTAYATPERAVAAEKFRGLVQNSVYAFSSEHNIHGRASEKTRARVWDNFVSAVRVGENGPEIPVVFAVRTVDRDLRSQIYSIGMTTETATSRGNGSQDAPERRSPSYGGVAVSDGDTVSQEQREVKGLEKPDLYSADDEEEPQSAKEYARQQRESERDTRQPVAESRPIIAKRDLTNTLNALFSIPEGRKEEMGKLIDGYADRLLKHGELTQADRDAFFDRMYAEGVMTVSPDPYYIEGREAVRGGKIYVSPEIKGDFGDGWNDFRRRAFASGIYLTNNQNDPGVDVWNTQLAEQFPALFDYHSTDGYSMLENIVQLAEEGADEKMSLDQYARMLTDQEGISEDEILDNMERQMDWALRTFAEKANLEIKLRDRTGWVIAKERKRARDTIEEHDYRNLERIERIREQTAKGWKAQHERDIIRRAKEREQRKESAKRRTEERELRELQEKTLKTLQWLSKNRDKAPAEMKARFDEVLGDLDILAVGAARATNWSKKYNATWGNLAEMYKDAQANDPNFLPSKELQRIVDRLDKKKIAELDVGALNDLYKAAVGLKTEYENAQTVINDENKRRFDAVYKEAKAEIEKAKGGYQGGKIKGWFHKFMNLDQMTPMNVLARMTGWDTKGTFYSMAKQLEQGERKMRDYEVRAKRHLDDYLTAHEDFIKRADGQGKDAIWYEIEVPELLELGMGDKPIFGDTVKVWMTPMQKVHLYLESKNYDNLRHIAGGRTFANKELYSQGKRTEAFAQGKTIRLAPETVKKIVSDLTAEELELAGLLEKYYNGFAAGEINKVSNVLYGFDKAVTTGYAPIYTNKNYVKSEIGVFDVTAEGVGNLKGRVVSKNPSYNISALDAFERHVDQTARFVGMAIPAQNWTNLLNYREKNNSMGDVITHKWGEEGKQYITDLLTVLQGGGEKGKRAPGDMLLSQYITAVFGANPGIVFKQAASYPQFAAVLGFENAPSLAKLTHIDEDVINAYTSELAYRQLGYATPETATLKNNPSKLDTNKVTRFLFRGGAITAMDAATVKGAWAWAENKVRRENPNLEMGSREDILAGKSTFYKKVAEEWENAVSLTQPMYDVMHRANIMQNSKGVMRAFTMFKTVPLQQYNTLRRAFGELQSAKTSGNQEEIKAASKGAATAVIATLASVLMLEGVELLNQLVKNGLKNYRDDDDELTAGSIGAKVATKSLGDIAGMVIGGDELSDVLANWFLGEKWYGIEIPGGEQLNDVLDSASDAVGTIQKIITEGANIAVNGGDLAAYWQRNAGDYAGAVKEIAEKVSMYLGGFPVENIEKYLMGATKAVAPELAVAMEDAFNTPTKGDLGGLTGEALGTRVRHILKNRGVEVNEETAGELARLYKAGEKGAVATDTPKSISVNSDERELNAYQRQTYDFVWGSVVRDNLETLVGSEGFQQAEDGDRAGMVEKLYSYAADEAKGTLFDDYEKQSKKIREAMGKGASLVEAITAQQGEKITPYTRWLDSEAREAGVSQEVYVEFRKALSKMTSDKDKDGKPIKGQEKKDKALKYINGLDLTRQQKDTLFYDADYKESTINEAPWHDGTTIRDNRVPKAAEPEGLSLPRLDEESEEDDFWAEVRRQMMGE